LISEELEKPFKIFIRLMSERQKHFTFFLPPVKTIKNKSGKSNERNTKFLRNLAKTKAQTASL